MAITRRNLLRGLKPKASSLPFPPWSGDGRDFTARCTGCGECVTTCPQHILVMCNERAAIDFARGGCTLCGDCVSVCPTGALSLETNSAFQRHAVITDGCLTRHRVECRVCGENCEAGAIRFTLHSGSPATPTLNDQLCTGCGQCFMPCPASAIQPGPLQETL